MLRPGLIGVLALAAGCGAQQVERSEWFRVSRRDFESHRFITHPEYLESLAASYWDDERYDDARDTYLSALQMRYGDSFDGHVALGRLYERAGNTNRAVAHYARAASLDPSALPGWYALHRVRPTMTIAPDGLQADGYNPRTMGKKPDEGGDDAGSDAPSDG
jgi:tetratricopeptide (TPR) repeat protein